MSYDGDDYTTGSLKVVDALMLPLIFHSADPVSESMRKEWKRITGSDQMTTKVMCDHLRLMHELTKVATIESVSIQNEIKWWEATAASHRALCATVQSSAEIGYQATLIRAADDVVAALHFYTGNKIKG